MSQRRSDVGSAPQPKPYRFVALPRGIIPRQRPAGHDEFEAGLVSGMMVGVITALTPVHVASGQIEMSDRKDPPLVKAHVRVGERPVIPGSSLKGSIRSIVEAISASCIRITRARRDQQPREAAACQNLDRLCVACRMFGALGYQGQVRLSDAVLRGNRTEIVEVPSFYAPRPRERLYYEGGQIKGRKFYEHGKLARGNVPIEVCPVGSCFDFSVQFDNLAPAELGLLLIALGQGEPRLRLKLGGAKPACCGTIEIALTELRVLDMAVACTQYDATRYAMDISVYVAAAQELVLADQLRSLAQILRYPNERECPESNY